VLQGIHIAVKKIWNKQPFKGLAMVWLSFFTWLTPLIPLSHERGTEGEFLHNIGNITIVFPFARFSVDRIINLSKITFSFITSFSWKKPLQGLTGEKW